MPQAHKLYGTNRVFFGGRLISGPDSRSCIASFMMILLPSVIWQVQVATWFADRYTMGFGIFGAMLQVASLSLLLVTAFSDPGIMPRQKEYTENYDSRTQTYRSKQPPRYYDLVLRGHPFKLKYCTTCNIYRPPRCTHCSVCDNCIERFDHHCPWIGNCIGKRNYRWFYSFVSTTGTLNFFVLATSVSHVAVLTTEYKDAMNLGSGDALLEAMREAPLSTSLAIYGAAIVWFTMGLMMYHAYLICTNQTTYEQIKGVYSSGTNPFYRGIGGNCQDILCSKIRPRYFNAHDNRLIWNSTPADESARELRLPNARGEQKYIVKDSPKGVDQVVLGSPEKTTTKISHDPFLIPNAGVIQKQEPDEAPPPQTETAVL